MKRYIAITTRNIICVILMLSLSGCWNSRELDTLGIVLGVGIDKPEDEQNKVQITAQIVKPGEIGKTKGGGGGGGGGANPFWNVQGTGDTVFGTIRDLTNVASRKLFYSHNQVMIFGQSAAKGGVQKYIDFFERGPETRNTVLVLVADGKAGEILDVKPEQEQVPANNIAKLVKGQAAATSQVMAVRLTDFMGRLLSETTAPVAPMIEVVENENTKMVMISGTAVFKSDKLVGKLDYEEGRGLLWALGKVKSGVIEVKDHKNELVSLEIIRAKGKITPSLENDKITMKIDIIEEGNITEIRGSEDITELSDVKFLENEKVEKIRSEVMAAVKKAKELDADIFGFGDAVRRKYPDQYEKLKGNWDELFETIDVEVNVEAKLRLMGEISKPVITGQG